MMQCPRHPEEPAAAACPGCLQRVCRACIRGGLAGTCASCIQHELAQLQCGRCGQSYGHGTLFNAWGECVACWRARAGLHLRAPDHQKPGLMGGVLYLTPSGKARQQTLRGTPHDQAELDRLLLCCDDERSVFELMGAAGLSPQAVLALAGQLLAAGMVERAPWAGGGGTCVPMRQPVRLGEWLVAKGELSGEHLENALVWMRRRHGAREWPLLGEVLQRPEFGGLPEATILLPFAQALRERRASLPKASARLGPVLEGP